MAVPAVITSSIIRISPTSASELEFDVLFGPAYKGIPLATAAAMALNDSFNKNVWTFIRLLCFSFGSSLIEQHFLMFADVK
jgi:orotate phosphoribosyltransferase